MKETNGAPELEGSQDSAHAELPRDEQYMENERHIRRSGVVAQIIASFATIVVGIAWPGAVIWLVMVGYGHLPSKETVEEVLDHEFGQEKLGEATIAISREGVQFQVKAVNSGLINSPTTAPASEGAQPAPLNSSLALNLARSSVKSVATVAAEKAWPIATILWVDPHPANNIGLQYAFQSLGFLVVTIQDNDSIDRAFQTARGNVDVVITNMSRRDEVEGRIDDRAGLKTVELIKSRYPSVPVIIYSGAYGAAHRNEVAPPIVLTTNVTEDVFKKVVSIASAKAP
jgi:CheY-like chemotaxis protein